MSKKPFVSVDALEAITKTYPTPFHLYNKAEIVRRAKLLQEAFSWNAGFKEYFAVKATPNPYIVRLLAELGCGCDCANATELTLAKACGVTGQNIMLSSNDTTVLDFARAHELGAIINLDAGGDMLTTLEEAVGSNMPQVMCARLNPGGVFESQNGIIGNPDDAKFGMTEEQLFQTFAYLKTKGVTEFGLHAFLASNAQEEDYYPNLARVLFELAVKLHRELDIHIGFIDLSGGIGVAYEPDQVEPDVLAIGQGVKR
ncbi:MAG: diaminopimelate decarboxylase, partial [Lancefieldella parvula]|nr:diaminopimelate decarboxylase [Lancefieldella parvula]